MSLPTKEELADLRRLAEACPATSEQGYCCACGRGLIACFCNARVAYNKCFRDSLTVLSLLDALDAQDRKLAGVVTKEQAIAAVVDELANAWSEGYQQALSEVAGARKEPNPYRKDQPR